MKTGIEIIAEERDRQIAKEGYTKEHDSQYRKGELGLAAASYAIPSWFRAAPDRKKQIPFCWPFSDELWKPTPNDRIKELAKAGALIAAEIDRLIMKEK